MTQALFRREVLEARRGSWLGGIVLAQPLRLWVLASAGVLAAALVVLFLVIGSYTRRSTVAGYLVPSKGLATVLAPATGVVARLDVAEGDKVEAGQALAVVTVPRATVTGGDTLAALEERMAQRREGLSEGRDAQRQLRATQESGIRTQMVTAGHELAQIEAEIATKQAQIAIAEETLHRLRQLEGERYVSLLEIKQQESSALSWRGEMQALQRQALSSRRMLAQLQQTLDELPGQMQVVDATHRRELAVLEQEQLETRARGELALAAPVAGLVSAQLVKPGQAVQVGQPLLSLLPADDALEAELLVPSRAIGFIEPGDTVLLRYQAYPYQKFGHHEGKVSRISRSALGPGETGAGNAQQSEPLYRVTVLLAKQAVTAFGSEEPLRPGMLLDADILGERRRLIEWVFEPIYSLRGKLANG